MCLFGSRYVDDGIRSTVAMLNISWVDSILLYLEILGVLLYFTVRKHETAQSM